MESVRSILKAVHVPCELGGGIRDDDTIASLLELGLSRLVIGTKALREPDWFRQLCRRFPDRLVLGIDARDGRVATDGWLETSNTSAVELAKQFDAEPIAALIYTDIATDGMLAGPNVSAMREMQQAVRIAGNRLRRRHDCGRRVAHSPRSVSPAASSAARCTRDGLRSAMPSRPPQITT